MQIFSKFRVLLFLGVIAIFCCTPVTIKNSKIIRISGSDTMLILTNRWAEAYMLENPTISIYTEGGGTEKGVQALIDGQADICAASRPLRPHEARMLAEKYGKLGMSFLVAKDALSVYLNPQNTVQNLSINQLKHIFTGDITNWQRLGGPDEPIQVVLRPPNSGTFLYFQEHILDGEGYLKNAITLPTTRSIVHFVELDPAAIGYGGLAYGANIIHCKIDQVEPTVQNVQNDTYPIIRYLYLYTVDSPRGKTKDFIDWVLKAGQHLVKKTGYIPLWEVK